MKIEVGKWYRLDCGFKAMVLSVSDEWIETAVKNPPGSKSSWGFSGFSNPNRIICEWVDKPKIDRKTLPAWHKWMAMDHTGKWFSYTKKPELGTDGYWRADPNLLIPVDYAPNWSGSYNDSLIELDNQED